MKDILGREIKVGDVVAHGTRSGNSGALSVKIIADHRFVKDRWSDRQIEKVKVINFTYMDRKWNRDTREWEDLPEPQFEKGGSGWSEGGTFLVVNESVPDDVKNFLKGSL